MRKPSSGPELITTNMIKITIVVEDPDDDDDSF